jgi:hypothetical protein
MLPKYLKDSTFSSLKKKSLCTSQRTHCVLNKKTIRLTTLIEITASIIISLTSLFASFRIPHSPNHISYHKIGSTRNVANKLYLIWVYERGDVDSSLLACYTASFRKQFHTFRMIEFRSSLLQPLDLENGGNRIIRNVCNY